MNASLFSLLHVSGATVGLLSGSLAMLFRKGSGLHRAAGTVFFGSMLLQSACAVGMAVTRSHSFHVQTSLLTFYLVLTGWLAARRTDEKTRLIDFGGFVLASVIAAVIFVYGWQAAHMPNRVREGYPATLYFIFATIALLFAGSDLRMLVRGGVAGARRIARHLLRMCVALLFAFLSFYPGQARLIPAAIRKTNVLYLPSILILIAMIFWLCRVLLSKRSTGAPVSAH